MRKLLTVDLAKREIEYLQNFISLVENYEVDTIEHWIIKEYAITNSIKKVILNSQEKGISLEKEFVTSIIRGKAKDDLHKIVKSIYKCRIKKPY